MASLNTSRLAPALLLVSLAASWVADSLAAAEPRLIDLTHPFDVDTVYWPTDTGFNLKKGTAGVTERGYFYAANRFAAPEHGGTHLDAPYHFAEGGQTVEQIPLDRLVGPGACVDVSPACAVDRDYLVTIDDLKRWEQEHDATLHESIVLLRTGFAAHWPNREQYLGTSGIGDAAVANLHFPGLHPAAAAWLATARRVKAVGIDTASIDNGPSREFQSHVTLFKHEVPALENVASMNELPPTGFRVVALPMMIAQGTGAPCRVIAIVEE